MSEDAIIFMPTHGISLRMADCHPDRPHHAKGLCTRCYQQQQPVRSHAGEMDRRRARPEAVAVRCPRCLAVSEHPIKVLDGDPRCSACRVADALEPDIPRERYVCGLRLAA